MNSEPPSIYPLVIRGRLASTEARGTNLERIPSSLNFDHWVDTEDLVMSGNIHVDAKLEQAVLQVGFIAIGHARLEEAVDYLAGQLQVYVISQRRGTRGLPKEELQRKLRDIRTARLKDGQRFKPLSAIVDEADRLLTDDKTIGQRLTAVDPDGALRRRWIALRDRLHVLNRKRNEAVHSAVHWSSGGLQRESGGGHYGARTRIDIEADKQLACDIGDAATEAGVLATDLARSLPFASEDTITTIVLKADLSRGRRRS